MPLMPMLLYVLFGAALFGGGGALLHYMQPPESERQDTGERTAAADPEAQQPSAPDSGAEKDAASGDTSGPAPEQAQPPKPAAPSFDVVRIEKSGEGVVAGRAEPGWMVVVESGDREVARATADRYGEWTVVLDEPLPPGEHSIGLRALSQGAARGLTSEEHVSVSVAREAGDEKTVVALSRPGEPTRVLTSEEPSGEEKSGTETAKPDPEAGTEERQAREPEPESARKKEEATAEPEPEEEETAAAAPESERERTREPAAASEETERVEELEKAEESEKVEETPPAMPEVAVSFSAVDYEADGADGRLFLSGEAEPGARVNLYLDNARIGSAVADADGRWTYSADRELKPEAEHAMRADAVQADGQVTSRAEVAFTPPAAPQPERQVAAKSEPPAREAETADGAESGKREEEKAETAEAPEAADRVARAEAASPRESKPEDAGTASKEPDAAPADEAKPEPAPDTADREPRTQPASPPEAETAAKEPESAPAAEAKPEPEPETARETPAPARTAAAPEPEEAGKEPETASEAVLEQKRSIVVRRGDTLWHIAERRYGSGTRYTAIYRDNRKQIRNPHWIYPGQEFSLPSN